MAKDNQYLQKHLEMIGQYELLTFEEEQDLARRIKDGGDAKAREKMVLHNLRLVVWIAKKYWRYGPNIEDLIQAGNEGLLVAVDKFDHTRGTKFSTYATWWIKNRIRELTRVHKHNLTVPRGSAGKLQKLKKKAREGKALTPKEERILTELDEAIWKARTATTIFLVSPEGDQSERGQISRRAKSPSLILEAQEALDGVTAQIQEIDQALSDHPLVTEVDRQTFLDYFRLNGDDRRMTLQSLGDRQGVTRERIRQINADLIVRLGHAGIRITHDALEALAKSKRDLEEFVEVYSK